MAEPPERSTLPSFLLLARQPCVQTAPELAFTQAGFKMKTPGGFSSSIFAVKSPDNCPFCS